MRRNKIVEENTLKDDGDDGTWPVIFKATAQHTRAMNVRSLSTHLANGLILATHRTQLARRRRCLFNLWRRDAQRTLSALRLDVCLPSCLVNHHRTYSCIVLSLNHRRKKVHRRASKGVKFELEKIVEEERVCLPLYFLCRCTSLLLFIESDLWWCSWL